MATKTTASPRTLSEDSTTPQLRHFQMNAGITGDIAESVNLFRGDVVLPIDLVSLRCRGGLETTVTINYQSDVAFAVDTWNLECPTGILGLGWSMGYEAIAIDHHGSISPYDDDYYMIGSDGSCNRLYPVSKSGTVWVFEAESHQFSDIRYFPDDERWQVTQVDGLVRVYGGAPTAREQGLSWGGPTGNWTDSSRQLGQARYTLVWALSEVRNLFGDRIQFEYTDFPDDSVQIGGPSGLAYTRARYLQRITDPAGHVITLRYGQKVHDATRREYQPPHATPAGGLHAHQDRYETRYLDSIAVTQEELGSEQELFTIRFMYGLEAYSGVSTEKADLYKRYLRAATVTLPDGKLLPGMLFDYYTGAESSSGEVHRGALKTVTYPEGGTVTYAYERIAMGGTQLDHTLDRGETGAGVPRLWFGSTYAVLTRYDVASSRMLAVNVYDWNGRWIHGRPLELHLEGELDLPTLNVDARDDYFLLGFETTGTGSGRTLHAHAINRRFGRFGEWDVHELAMPAPLGPDSGFQLVAGNGFVAAAAQNDTKIVRHVWQPRERVWVPSPAYLDPGGHYVLGAFERYLAICVRTPGASACRLVLSHLDGTTLAWREVTLDTVTAVWDDELPEPAWSLAPTFATLTFIEAEHEDRKTLDYELRTYLWDRNLQNIQITKQSFAEVPISTQEPFFVTVAAGSLVGNIGNLARYDGNGWVFGTLGSFDEGHEIARFTYGNDLAIGGSDQRATLAAFDPVAEAFVSSQIVVGSQGPSEPTISGDYATVRDRIYHRRPDGSLAQIGQLLSGATHVSNQGPRYVAYGRPDGSSYVHMLKNGAAAPSAALVAGRMFVDGTRGTGTLLCSASAFATFTGPSFDAAETITLHYVVNGRFQGPVEDFVVTKVTTDGGIGEPSSSVFEYVGDGTVGPFGLASQYTRVKSASGTTSFDSTPFGHTVQTFFNGLAPPEGPDLAYACLDGLLAKEEVFDASGRLVGAEIFTWEVVREIEDVTAGRAVRRLIGAYARPSKQEQQIFDLDEASPADSRPPLSRVVELEYDEGNGRVRVERTWSFGSENAQELLEEIEVFAYERYPELVEQHVLAAVAERTTRVDGRNVSISAVTWKGAWAHEGETVLGWAPCREYLARHEAATLRPSDWRNETSPSDADWQRQLQVEARDRHGNIVEYVGRDGLINTRQYDASGRVVVASFGNASHVKGQVAYLGFEAYELLHGWTLGGTEAALRAAIIEGDAHSGSRSLQLGGPHPLALTLSVGAHGRYVLSCWVKTEPGFGSAPGDAGWAVRWGGHEQILPIADTDATWRYIFLIVDIGEGTLPVGLTLSLTNGRSKLLWVDDVRFSPLFSDFQAFVYDSRYVRPIASLVTSGQTRQQLHGDFESVVIDVDEGFAVTSVRSRYLSRRANAGMFGASRPNSELALLPQGWGFLQSFDLGEQWRVGWSTDDFDRWVPRSSGLVHQAGRRDVLTYEGIPEDRASYGLALRMRPETYASASLGIAIGTSLEIAWDPRELAWRVIDEAGPGALAPRRVVLEIPWAAYRQDLDAGILPPQLGEEFSLAGLPLSGDGVAQVVEAGERWRIDDGDSGVTYYLGRSTTDAAKIDVVVLSTELLLAIRGRDLVFFADGGHAIGYRATAPITDDLGVFAEDAVVLDNVVFFTDLQISVSFFDGVSRKLQEQVDDATGPIATATVYDAFGRPAISSQGARLDPAPSARLAYEPDLCRFDWSTLQLTGIVAVQNPSSEGYAYARKRFEDSPLGRVVEEGLPGAALAITRQGNSHTTRTTYGLNDGALGYTAGKYLRTTVTSPDGNVTTTLTSLRGMDVLHVTEIADDLEIQAVTSMHHDAAGNLTRIVTPMSWSDDFTYDFLGNRLTATLANQSGPTRYMYDALDRLRFRMDPRGAASHPPYTTYWKYDEQSRVVEEGGFAAAWEDLASHVDDQSWPPAVPSNIHVYDGVERGDLLTMGFLAATKSQNQVGGPGETDAFTAVEEIYYDIWTQRTKKILRVDAFSDATYEVLYDYDNQGRWIGIHYPGPAGGSGGVLHVQQQFDPVGRIGRLAFDDETVTYAYDVNGKIARESYHASGALVVERTYAHTPAGWLTSIEDRAGGDPKDVVFRESIEYTSGGYQESGYYDGSPARITTCLRGGSSIVTRLGYDRRGQLRVSDVSGIGPIHYDYDRNGNLTRIGAATLTYSAATHDRVQSFDEGASKAQMRYDASGNTVEIGPGSSVAADGLTLDIDWYRNMPLRASMGTGAGRATQEIRYGHGNRRVHRAIAAGSESTEKLYVRGLGNDPLVEISTEGADAVCYVYGPTGLVLVHTGGESYFVSRDQVGSIRAVLGPGNQLVGGYDYLPFGAPNGARTGSNPRFTPYRFTSRELDASGLYDFRARLYAPALGRFVSPDAVQELSSPYVYVGNDPVAVIDPSGNSAAVSGIIGALAFPLLIGAAIGLIGGTIQAGITISHEKLRGWEAAGVFFGMTSLSWATGATTGALTGAAGYAIESTALVVAASSLIIGAGAAVESAGHAAMSGADPGAAAWQGAALAMTATVVAATGTAVTSYAMRKARLKLSPKVTSTNPTKSGKVPHFLWKEKGKLETVLPSVVGAIGGGTMASVASALNGDSRPDALRGMLQSIAIGAVAGFLDKLPALASHYRHPHQKTPAERRIEGQRSIGKSLAEEASSSKRTGV